MKKRIATAIVAIPIVLGVCLCTHPLPFIILSAVAFGIGAFEFLGFVGRSERPLCVAVATCFAALAAAWLTYRQGPADYAVLLAVLVIGASSLLLSVRTDTLAKKGSFVLISELFSWVGAPLIAIVLLHAGGWNSWTWNLHAKILLLFLPLWAGDTTGIVVGSTLGRHALAPLVSPKKTIEGAVGNFIVSTGIALALAPWVQVSLPIAALCGATIGVVGQAGDLFESYVKRKAEVKDSGGLLPGHGGLLDRIDSLLFSAIPVALLLATR